MGLLDRAAVKKTVGTAIMLAVVLAGIFGVQSEAVGNSSVLEGYLKKIGGDSTLVLETYDGKTHYLPVAAQALFSIDQVPVTLSDFKPGMEVRATISGNQGVTFLAGFSTVNKGYLQPGGKVRSGMVVAIESGRIWLRLETGAVESYVPSAYTLVTKNGRRVDLGTLYQGDRVKLYFDQHNSPLISRLEIQSDYTEIKEVYKGRLAIQRNFGNNLVLENVQVLRDGAWVNHRPVLNIPAAGEQKLYAGGRPISQQQLRFYQGSEVYLLTRDFFGREQAERLMVKDQFENAFVDKIESINLYTGTLELARTGRLQLTDDAFIITNRRLVDQYGLFAAADAFVVTNGQGPDRLGRLIYVYNADLNNSPLGRNQLYFGRLNIVTEDAVWLDNFFLLSGNTWEYQHDLEKVLFYGSDTYIFDRSQGVQIPPDQFPLLDYAVDEDSYYAWDNKLKDWYGYIFTQGDQVLAISLLPQPEDWSQQRVATGIVKSTSQDESSGYWRVTLQGVSQWSNLREQWVVQEGELELSLAGALVLKDGAVIDPEAVKAGAWVYLVRDEQYGKLLLVK